MRSVVFIKSCLALAALLIWSGPSLANVLLTYHYVAYQPPAAGSTRIPRSSGAGGLHEFAHSPGGSIAANMPFPVPLNPAPPPGSIDPSHYVLASATIAGAKQGVAQAFPPLAAWMTVSVGTGNIDVTYIYLPTGGGCPTGQTCPSGSEAVIDEASEATGGLLDDEFVSVYEPPTAPSPDAALTHSGNYLGVVDTGKAVRINADEHPVNPANQQARTGTVFDRWVSSVAPAQANDVRDLDLAAGTDGYFLANYRNYCPNGFHFVASATTSECVADNCPSGQVWSAADNKCIAASCPKGETCGNFTCPKLCVFGCIVVPPNVAFNHSSKPVFACKNAKGGIGTEIP